MNMTNGVSSVSKKAKGQEERFYKDSSKDVLSTDMLHMAVSAAVSAAAVSVAASAAVSVAASAAVSVAASAEVAIACKESLTTQWRHRERATGDEPFIRENNHTVCREENTLVAIVTETIACAHPLIVFTL